MLLSKPADDIQISMSSPYQFDWQLEFNEIRSYFDQEAHPAILGLLEQGPFASFLDAYLKQPAAIDSLTECRSISEFQNWMLKFIVPIVRKTFDGFTIEGLKGLSASQGHIFVSNHRDILMDPLLINLALLENGFNAADCAIGDNLLFSPQAATLAGLNRCFRVVRSLSSPKAMLTAMRIQSAYINYLRFQHNKQIWIAQKEGRSKNAIDITNPALIKMLSLAKPKDVDTELFFEQLAIVPVSISYEWDPCDISKAKQLLSESSAQGYVKSKEADLNDMRAGLLEPKGNIHLSFGEPIERKDGKTLNRYEIANQIDLFIAEQARIFPSNLAASQLLGIEHEPVLGITSIEIEKAKRILDSRLAKEPEQVRIAVLKAYSQALLRKPEFAKA